MVAYTRPVDMVFKALADPTRRLILDELSERRSQTLYEMCVRLTMKHKVSMSRQAIAKHLAILEDAALVRSSRRGRYRLLVFNDAPIRRIAERWVKRVIRESARGGVPHAT
jgi:DNA-binding transcriptional ArsR family regulator